MQATVLGPLGLYDGDDRHGLPSGQVGRLLELFLLRPDHPFSADELIDALWDDDPDTDVGRRRLRVTISRLRTFLNAAETDQTDTSDELQIVRDDGAYRLSTTAACLDRRRFEETARRALSSGRPDELERALMMWSGRPYDDVGWPDIADGERAELTALHQELLAARLAIGGGFARTKIRPPVTSDLHVPRPRLIDRLPAPGIGRSASVVAPAGFGKSTLLAQWATRHRNVAWMSLDADDNDPVRLWALLARGLESAGVIDGHQTLEGIDLSSVIDPEQRAAIVIDDVHTIDDDSAIDTLASIVDSLVATGVAVAVGSRPELDERVVRSLGSGAVSLRADDLRFQMDEVSSLFPDLDRHRRYETWNAVDGWPIGVVSLIRSGAATDATPEQPTGHDMGSLSAYVNDEVLTALDDDLVTFLLTISPLDSFSVALCNSVTGRDDAADLLERLRRHGLFLVETRGESDLHSGWYRLHHGVADELRRRAATRVDLDGVLQRAARWYLDRGFKAAALRCAIAGGEVDIVARTAGDVVLERIFLREISACIRLVTRLDPSSVESDYRSHSVCSAIAALWLTQADRMPWAQSRLRTFGADDPVVLMERARSALINGSAHTALDVAEQLLERLDGDIDESVLDLVPVFSIVAREYLLRAKAYRLELGHDDPMFARVVTEARHLLPLVAAWSAQVWATVALLDGNEILARSLAEEFHQARMTMVTETSLQREQTPIGALLAGMDTDDGPRLRRIASELETYLDTITRFGDWVRTAKGRIVAAHLYRRAGDHANAVRLDGLADVLIRTFEHVPLVTALRDHLSDDEDTDSPTSLLVWSMTARQRQVLPYLLSGDSPADIAERLHISVNTLNGHLQAIYGRLRVSSRAAAAARLSSIDLTRFDDTTTADASGPTTG